jgi:hypothetical protein
MPAHGCATAGNAVMAAPSAGHLIEILAPGTAHKRPPS